MVKSSQSPWTTYNRSAAAMYRYLDRGVIEKRRERAMRNYMRRIENPKLRKFALSLVRVMTVETGPEICIRKKVISRCKIGRATYFEYLKILD